MFVRFTRWSMLRVWDAAVETLASLGPLADAEQNIEKTARAFLSMLCFSGARFWIKSVARPSSVFQIH